MQICNVQDFTVDVQDFTVDVLILLFSVKFISSKQMASKKCTKLSQILLI